MKAAVVLAGKRYSLSDGSRQRWLESYVEQLLTRDAEQADGGRDPARLRRYFEAYAINTAGIVDDKSVYDAAGINRKTALAYETLLTNLLVVEAMPAWTTNRLKRLVLSPKRYVVDPALVTAVLRLDVNAILRSGDLLGRLLDTFVVSQLRAELTVTSSRPRLYHVRQEQGRFEVDVIAELGGGQIVAIEVKASAAPTANDARHLTQLRDRLGDTFLAGIVFHTGPRVYGLADRITAAPISTLWAAPPGQSVSDALAPAVPLVQDLAWFTSASPGCGLFNHAGPSWPMSAHAMAVGGEPLSTTSVRLTRLTRELVT